MTDKLSKAQPDSLFSILVRDIHFWIPLLVLLAGLVFLHELR